MTYSNINFNQFFLIIGGAGFIVTSQAHLDFDPVVSLEEGVKTYIPDELKLEEFVDGKTTTKTIEKTQQGN